MATARKLPSGNWRVRIFIKGHNPEYISFTSTGTSNSDKTKVELEALNYKKSWMGKQNNARASEMTLGDAIDQYIQNKTSVLSPQTICGYNNLRRNTLQTIMDMRLSRLTQAAIQSAINKDAARLSPKTVRNAHWLLSSTLQECHPEFRLATKLPQRAKTEITIPEKHMIDSLLEEGRGSIVGAVVLCGAVLGLRRSEMCALTWSDIDLAKGTVRINKAIVQNDAYEWVLKKPKSYAGFRMFSIPAFAVEYLRSIPRYNEWVIPLTPVAAAHRFRKLVEKCGMKMRLHDLRHYNASVMLALGVPDKYAMERLGQSTPAILRTVYQHLMEDKRTEVATQIDDYFSGSDKNRPDE